MPAGVIKQAEATITASTDTELVAAVEATQHIEVLELYAVVFTAGATSKLRFESAAGSGLLAGLGMLDGATLGDEIARDFTGAGGYKIAAAKGISVETTDSSAAAVYYVYVKYRLVNTAQ